MKVKFGVCADLHCDFIHDSFDRFKAFMDKCTKSKVDFCIQLGDFCPPGDSNFKQKEQILKLIESSSVPFYHVLGNHDMDGNSKSAVLAGYGIDSSYYSFDFGGVHFAALDACNFRKDGKVISYDIGNYKAADGKDISVLDSKQLDWLRCDLARASYPTVLFSHQSLVESRACIGNTAEFREAIRTAPCGVIAAFCGHEHVDRAELKDGVWYYCVNSMSYYWAGGKYDHNTYGHDIEKNNPNLRKVFPYRDSLFAIIEIDDDAIHISGKDSDFVGKSPDELDFVKHGLCDPITPFIENKVLLLK